MDWIEAQQKLAADLDGKLKLKKKSLVLFVVISSCSFSSTG